jgi:hypothetical protein
MVYLPSGIIPILICFIISFGIIGIFSFVKIRQTAGDSNDFSSLWIIILFHCIVYKTPKLLTYLQL